MADFDERDQVRHVDGPEPEEVTTDAGKHEDGTYIIHDFDTLHRIDHALANEIAEAVMLEQMEKNDSRARGLCNAIMYHVKTSKLTVRLRAEIGERMDELAGNFDGVLLGGGEKISSTAYQRAYDKVPTNKYWDALAAVHDAKIKASVK